MPRPFENVDSVDTDEGKLELLRRGDDDWIITIDRRVLMSSRLHRSEVALAELACEPLAKKSGARVLVAGLGMGYTLRAALDSLSDDATVIVAELNPIVAQWNRGPIADLSGRALEDKRTTLEIIDVSVLVRRAANAGVEKKYDAIGTSLTQWYAR